MKSAGAIRHQVKQVSFRHLKKKLEKELRTRPYNCAFNTQFKHPVGGDPCGVCLFPEQTEGRVCDIGWEGIHKARNCPFFETNSTKDQIKDEFREWLSKATLAEVAATYPDMAALLWVLQEEAPNREVVIEEGEDWEPDDLDTEEEFIVTVGSVNLSVSSSEEAETAKTELAGMLLAIETANTQHKTDRQSLESQAATIRAGSAENKRLDTTVTEIRAELGRAKEDLEVRTRDHGHVSGQVVELRRQLEEKADLPAPRVSWWSRLFGGGT